MVYSGKELLKVPPLDPWNQVPREDKALSDQIFAAIEHVNVNKELIASKALGN